MPIGVDTNTQIVKFLLNFRVSKARISSLIWFGRLLAETSFFPFRFERSFSTVMNVLMT